MLQRYLNDKPERMKWIQVLTLSQHPIINRN